MSSEFDVISQSPNLSTQYFLMASGQLGHLAVIVQILYSIWFKQISYGICLNGYRTVPV